MLRLQVETCRWQCLLCNREFSSKFCYLLHVKSVHGGPKELEINEDPFRPMVEDANCSSKPTDVVERNSEGNGPNQHDPANQEANRGGDNLKCVVCKKTYSSLQKLADHKKLHVNASKNQTRKTPRPNQNVLLKKSNKKTKFRKFSLLHAALATDEVNSAKEHDPGTNPSNAKEVTSENQSPAATGGSDIADRSEDESYSEDEEGGNESDASEYVPSFVKRKPKTERTRASNSGSRGTVKPNSTTGKPGGTGKPRAKPKKAREADTNKENNKQKQTEPQGTQQDNQENREGGHQGEAVHEGEVVEGIADPEKKRGTRRKPRECDVCHRIYANRSSLRAHLRLHTGEKPYMCSVCDKGFVRMGHLKQHMCSHTGLWPFKCGACGKGFMNPSRVSRHMKIHSDERPWLCDICGESFKEAHHLARHKLLHSGEKPYKCPICDDRYFIQAGNLKIHMKTHGSEPISEPSISMSDVQHEVITATVQPTAKTASLSITEQQTALEGLLAVSTYKDEIEELNKSDGKQPDKSLQEADNAVEKTLEKIVVTSEGNSCENVSIRNEIVLHIVPAIDQAMQSQCVQELSSIDQELLRQFATSVAQELTQSQQ